MGLRHREEGKGGVRVREGKREGERERGREEREGGREEEETLFCRSLFAPASISAFTASVRPYIADCIRAVFPSCPPQEEGEGHVTA